MWPYDTAIQVFSLSSVFSLLGAACVFGGVFFVLKYQSSKLPLLFSVIVSFVLAGVAYLAFFVALFLLSSLLVDTNFYPGIEQVAALTQDIFLYQKAQGNWPASPDVFASMDPQKLAALDRVAKTRYIFDAKTNSFYWFVRPSKYFVLVFSNHNMESNQGWNDLHDVYRLSNFFRLPEVSSAPTYPPAFVGPWDQLPQ
jgi:hypothetical protein